MARQILALLASFGKKSCIGKIFMVDCKNHQQVIADYTIVDQMGYYLSGPDTGRVWFDLEDYTGSNPLKGKTFDYKTANPATTKILSELMDLEVK